jgi:hypothetical protein
MGVRALLPNPKAGLDHPLPQGLDTEIHTPPSGLGASTALSPRKGIRCGRTLKNSRN